VAKEEVDISEAVGSFTNQEKKLFYSLIGYSEDESENQNITSAPREVPTTTPLASPFRWRLLHAHI